MLSLLCWADTIALCLLNSKDILRIFLRMLLKFNLEMQLALLEYWNWNRGQVACFMLEADLQ